MHRKNLSYLNKSVNLGLPYLGVADIAPEVAEAYPLASIISDAQSQIQLAESLLSLIILG